MSNPDPGQAVIAQLRSRMQIDDEWYAPQERGFTWWPYVLAQRVWATPMRDRLGVNVSYVHIETDLLRAVEDTGKALAALALVNIRASLNGCMLSDGRVRLHASVCAHRENLTAATDLAMHATALQLAESYRLIETLHEVLAGTVDVSAHPTSGIRQEPDDMLNVERLYRDGKSIDGVIDFEQLAAGADRCWTFATGGSDGFTAELPLTRDALPALLLAHLQTALYEARVMEHPHWGDGLGTRLSLPRAIDPESGASLANYLNNLEATSPDCHQLGAWSVRDNMLTFWSFLPSPVFRDTTGYATPLFGGLVFHAAARAVSADAAVTDLLQQ